ncbi:MAG: response regulator [Dehalococcoidia bacterium]|jgi:response regulator RpfG family c-di-GMP phosphodiesterase
MTAKKGVILLVDDEAMIRQLLSQKLSSEGYRCEQAANAEQALEKLEKDSIELVILDIKMPGKSGVQLLPEIKAKYPDTAVIMATAVDDASIAINCMKAGAYDYLTKPFNLEEVGFSVTRALERRRLELENRDYQQHLEHKVEEQAQKIRTSFFNAITALAYALEAKDFYTSGHSQRVTEISVAIAKHLGLDKENIEKIRLASLVHDIGKIGVREVVLNKPGSLSDEEYEHVRLHSVTGERILKPIVDDGDILKAVRHHHERYDGTGYPDGLKGEQIPQLARIIAVADTFDAMTSERPYRKALTKEAACAEVERCRGTQFDPEAADAFLEVWRIASKTG